MENHFLLTFTFVKDFCLLPIGASSKIIQFAARILISPYFDSSEVAYLYCLQLRRNHLIPSVNPIRNFILSECIHQVSLMSLIFVFSLYSFLTNDDWNCDMVN
jgi:hypothetical protein